MRAPPDYFLAGADVMPRADASREDRSTRVFRALTALYPAAFRDEYQRELRLVFIDRYRDARGTGDRVRLWLDVLTGIAIEAPKEHYRMILQDLRYALRALRRHLLVTATIVITLGLGIGVNSAMFSLLNAIVLRTLPVPNPDSLFAVRGEVPLASGNRFSGPMLERLRQAAPDDVPVAAMSRVARVYTRTEGAADTEAAALQLVSSNYFQVLGLRPSLGQGLPDDGDGAAPVAMVSYRYWLRRFAGDQRIAGRSLTINGTSFTIVGVGPQAFDGVWLESPVDVWVPLTMQSAVKYSQNYSADRADQNRPWLSQERIWWLDVIALARPERAAVATSAFNAGVQEFLQPGVRIRLEPFGKGFSTFRQRFTTPLFALFAMAALVLLIACANVANLLLARAAGRQREIAVRMSLGAGRARLVHQLLTESVLLVVMASGAALLFARWAGDLLVRIATASSAGPAPFAAAIDLRVWGFTAAVALMSVLLFGVLPAWRTTRLDLAAAIKAGARGASAGSAARPARLLVVMQVALSLVLVTGTGLLARSFHNLVNFDLGFDRDHLLSVAVDPRLIATTGGERADLQQRVLDSVASVPGVRSAALAMCGLQSNCRAREDGFEIEGYQSRPDEQVVFLINAVSPNYFSTVGMRLVAGRALTDRDLEKTPKVAVVNRTLAAKYFRNGQAIGRRFGSVTTDVEIVGIVEDARQLNVKDAAVPAAFFPLAQRPVPIRHLEVRSNGDPREILASVRAAITRTAPDMPIDSIVPLAERVSVSLSEDRLVVFLTTGFGALALGLAGFGLFGVLSYAVARRASEFGIRMALGASRSRVLWSVVRDALRLVVGGFLLGLPIAFLSGRLVSSLFFGVSPHDWTTFLGATLMLVAVGSISSVLPALRACRVDPVVSLRQE
jgi:predicted permease